MAEGFVQVAPDSTGKKIRNLSLQILLSDGTVGTVYMQVIAIADENGNAILWTEEADWRVQLLDETRAVRIGLEQLLDAGQPPGARLDSLLDMAKDCRDNEDN